MQLKVYAGKKKKKNRKENLFYYVICKHYTRIVKVSVILFQNQRQSIVVKVWKKKIFKF